MMYTCILFYFILMKIQFRYLNNLYLQVLSSVDSTKRSSELF